MASTFTLHANADRCKSWTFGFASRRRQTGHKFSLGFTFLLCLCVCVCCLSVCLWGLVCKRTQGSVALVPSINGLIVHWKLMSLFWPGLWRATLKSKQLLAHLRAAFYKLQLSDRNDLFILWVQQHSFHFKRRHQGHHQDFFPLLEQFHQTLSCREILIDAFVSCTIDQWCCSCFFWPT